MPPDLIPTSITLKNYVTLLSHPFTAIFAVNTIIYSAISAVGCVLFCLVTSYFSLFSKSKIRYFIFYSCVIGIMIPRFALIIPQYVLLSKIGLLDSIIAICIPCIYNIGGLLMVVAYMETIPRSYYEMSQIDGASHLSIIIKVYAPLSKSILSAMGVFAAIGSSSDFLWQTLVISDKAKNTLIAGLNLIIRENTWSNLDNAGRPIGLQITASVIMFIPLLVYFIVGNKFYRRLDLSYKE